MPDTINLQARGIGLQQAPGERQCSHPVSTAFRMGGDRLKLCI